MRCQQRLPRHGRQAPSERTGSMREQMNLRLLDANREDREVECLGVSDEEPEQQDRLGPRAVLHERPRRFVSGGSETKLDLSKQLANVERRRREGQTCSFRSTVQD